MTESPSPRSPTEEELSKGESTRQEILQAALKLFTAQGTTAPTWYFTRRSKQ